jgi:hypothetical protein
MPVAARSRARSRRSSTLKARNVEVPDFLRERISTCTDLEQLETWIGRAATAATIDELFA